MSAAHEIISPEVRVTDYHTTGEAFRIAAIHHGRIPGATVAQRREYALASTELDRVQRMPWREQRGHAEHW